MKNKKTLFLALFLSFSPLVYAQSFLLREQAMDSTLSAVEMPVSRAARVRLEASSIYREQTPDEFIDQEIPSAKKTPPKRELFQERTSVSQERDNLIETTIRKLRVEMSLEYLFNVGGQQKYDVYDDLRIVSRKIFSYRGQMPLLKGEVRLTPRLSIGGRFTSGNLRKRCATDEKWRFWEVSRFLPDDSVARPHYIDYEINTFSSRNSVDFFDLNLYYRLLELDKEDIQQREGRGIPRKEGFWNGYLPDAMALDASLGYQQQNSRGTFEDPWEHEELLSEGSSRYGLGLPAAIGMDSFYKTCYKGAKVGFRGDIDFGKFTTRLNLGYVWLNTNAYGSWNTIRGDEGYYVTGTHTFEQNGYGGWGVDVGAELTYKFTPHLSAGFGVMCIYSKQPRMKESGNLDGAIYEDSDYIRNVINRFYSPSFILKYSW